MFPAGINIGKVKSFEVEDGANFYSIEVDLLTDMRTLSAVYVVDNLMRMEQIQLEEQTETDE
jgi:rod shape-determining protein MreC